MTVRSSPDVPRRGRYGNADDEPGTAPVSVSVAPSTHQQAASASWHRASGIRAASEAVTLQRYELPGAPPGGHPCDNLLLRADNMLRVVTAKRDGAQGF